MKITKRTFLYPKVTRIIREPEILLAPPPIKYGESDLSDVILIVEGQEFHVHKMTLASRSSYFKAMFYGNFREKDETRIELKEVSRDAFRHIMDFMYDGKISNEYPTFVSYIIANNKGFGELKTKHNDISDKPKHIADFWKVSSEVLDLADRFDIRKSFQQYFQNMLDRFICNGSSCFVCVTIHIFGFAYGLEYEFERHKKHDYKFIQEWFKLAEAAEFEETEKFTNVREFFKFLG